MVIKWLRGVRRRFRRPPVFRLPFPTAGADDPKRVFSWIYESNIWGGQGAGSAPDAVREYVAFVQDFLNRARAPRVVDVGCGDWSVAQLIDWTGREYLGIDVVGPLIASNVTRFGRAGIEFVAADVGVSPEVVPSCDVILVKDVMQHLPNARISQMLRLLGRCRFMIATNDFAPANRDCRVGDTRGLDLRATPFHTRPVAEHVLIPGKHTVVLRGARPTIRTGDAAPT